MSDRAITGPDRLITYVDWSESDGRYIATCERYPRLFALAPTRESAQAELLRLIAGAIDGEPQA